MSRFAPEIQALRDLLSSGAITKDEYEQKAKEYLTLDSSVGARFGGFKRPMMSIPAAIIVKSQSEVYAERNARDLSKAKILTPEEIEARQVEAKQNRRKTKGKQVSAVTVNSLGKPEKEKPIEKRPVASDPFSHASRDWIDHFPEAEGVSFTAERIDPTSEPLTMICEDGPSAIRRLVSLLLGGEYTMGKLSEGVCLTLRFDDGRTDRKWYAKAESAHSSGQRIMAEGVKTTIDCPHCRGLGKLLYGKPCEKCDRGKVEGPRRTIHEFSVDDTIYRVDLLEQQKAPARDQVIPSRKRTIMSKSKNYNQFEGWQKVSQDRCSFSRG